jgi:hypothetical protein
VNIDTPLSSGGERNIKKKTERVGSEVEEKSK